MTDNVSSNNSSLVQGEAALPLLKYYTCPHCECQATLVVDAETETQAFQDEVGNRYYQCISCQYCFAVNAYNVVVDREGPSSL